MPYWRISGFYFFYFATLGILVPYWGLYLQSIGFLPLAIGQLMALLMLTRIVAPLIWGWVADHHVQRMRVVRLTAWLTLISFGGVFLGQSFWWLAVIMTAFSFFWHASLPILEVSTMNHTAAQPGAYGRVRLWGSIGFIVSVLVLGAVIEDFGPRWVLPALLLCMLGIALYSMSLPETRIADADVHPGRFRDAIMRPQVFGFLLACLLMQVSHGPYYTFYSIYLDNYGYSKTVIGALWAFAVICEIGVFLGMQRLLARWALRPVLLASFVLAALRWLMIAYFPESLSVLIVAQSLHAASFGAFHATAMQMVHRFFIGRHQNRGQAVYGSASFGIGGAVGSFYSGYAWESLGPSISFVIAAGAAALAFVLAYALIRPKT